MLWYGMQVLEEVVYVMCAFMAFFDYSDAYRLCEMATQNMYILHIYLVAYSASKYSLHLPKIQRCH